MTVCRSLTTLALVAAAASVFAHGGENHRTAPRGPMEHEQMAWGIGADLARASRTVEVSMSDEMRFTPEHLQVREGETLRFRIVNGGGVMHEMVIGTREMLDEHAALMARFPNMEHDEPYIAHVAPGERGEIAWTFNRAGRFEFACLIPGHFQAGMTGTIEVVAAISTASR